MSNYKDLVIQLAQKTGNPFSAIQLKQFQTGVEQMARMLAPMTTKEKVDELTDRLLNDFSEWELESELTAKPEFILALLAIAKQSTIKFCQKR